MANDRPTVLTNSSQAARTIGASIFIENVDVDDIILKFNGKEISCDVDWDVIVKDLKAEREADKNAASRIRVFGVEAQKMQ